MPNQRIKLLRLAALAAASCVVNPEIVQRCYGENEMNQSPSPIDQHQYILLLRINSAAAGEWMPETRPAGSQPMLQREVRVEAHVREVFKAPTDRQIPADLKLRIKQRQPADFITSDDYGPWSGVDLVSGIDLLVFATDPTPKAPIDQALSDGCGLLVKVPNPQVPFAVEDVRHALEWERVAGRRLLESAQGRALVSDNSTAIGPLMASYLEASVAGEDLSARATVDTHGYLINLLQRADVNDRFRLVVLTHEIDKLVMTEAPPARFRVQLAAAMIHILEEDHADLLHDPIRQTYLVNSLFDANGKQLIPARDVLPTDAERANFESVLRKRGFQAERVAQLIRWLRGE